MELALNNFEVLDQTQMEEIDGGAFDPIAGIKSGVSGAVGAATTTYVNTGSVAKAAKAAVIGYFAGTVTYLVTCWW